MKFDEYKKYDALGLAELVRKGEVTASEVMEAAIEGARAKNREVNAINIPLYEEGRRLAAGELPDGPFRGVPFLVKDQGLHIKGVELTEGSAALKGQISSFDDDLVKRFREAGLVFFGRTNTPEFALLAVTEPKAYGPTRNPWDLEHTPGGSSGGSAAAVAAGIVPMASASDGGGSIRIPAAACGLFGLKPTRGRTPLGPTRAEGWDGATTSHVVSRTVRDSAAMLDALEGPAPGDPYQIIRPEGSYLELIKEAPRPLKVAFSTRSPLGTGVHEDYVAAVEQTARLLESLGHVVIEAEPEIDGQLVAKAYLTMYFGHVAAEMRWIRANLGKEAAKKVELNSRLLALIGEALPAGEFVEWKLKWNDFGRAMARFHESFDLYMTPTMAYPPVKIGELDMSPVESALARAIEMSGSAKILVALKLVDKMAIKNLSRTPFTQLANLTGQPAMSVPLALSQGGLPLGVQFIAPFGDEGTLFQLAAQLESSFVPLEP